MILHVSDLHFHPGAFAAAAKLATEHGADLCISGDLLRVQADAPGLREQMDWVVTWLRRQPFKVFVCSGNHDGDPAAPIFARWLRAAAVRDRVFVDGQKGRASDGLLVACVPYLGTFSSRRDQVLLAGVQAIVTHEPPAGSPVAGAPGGADAGSDDLAAFLEACRPPPAAVLCGHVHAPAVRLARRGGTWISNPASDFRDGLRACLLRPSDGGVCAEEVRARLD
jgi:Icc-related predicted phosphoesterase